MIKQQLQVTNFAVSLGRSQVGNIVIGYMEWYNLSGRGHLPLNIYFQVSTKFNTESGNSMLDIIFQKECQGFPSLDSYLVPNLSTVDSCAIKTSNVHTSIAQTHVLSNNRLWDSIVVVGTARMNIFNNMKSLVILLN